MPTPAHSIERLQQVESILGPCVVISVTATMLKKSIIDAIEPMRNLLVQAGVHDYAAQQQGEEHKVVADTKLLCGTDLYETTTSLYRPPTKNGDPRFWISRLGRVVQAGDQFAITVGKNGRLLGVVLTRPDWDATWSALRQRLAPLAMPLALGTANPALDELVRLLTGLSTGLPLRALLEADTAVGRTLEAALGIPMNPSKQPDFKGIELKFSRKRPAAKTTRGTLFAQVPDWSISPCKSSREILDQFGYTRNGDFKLYVEVGRAPNSRGLSLWHNTADATIEERSTRPDLPIVARWKLGKLEERLNEKHHETAWVKCESTRVGGVEHFRPVEVQYTTLPRLDVFPLLIAAGQVTLDHLIKERGHNSANEKGPLWKIEPGGRSLLFEGSQEIAL